ncbi:(d)CMP kinase [Buchnera aphidicola]|uniref:(d)CMP kinase n=1 Tax=Buchnera aphidicola TaxID=9 RepID=UPI003BEF4A86
MKKLPPVITIDGPSGAGKSTLCKAIANKLKWISLESGLIYRVIAFIALKNNIFITEKNIIPIVKKLDISSINKINKNILKNTKNNNYLTSSQKISHIASELSIYPYIRKILLKKQKLLRNFPGLVAEGRDMGTVVFPKATLKFFLNASLECRVQRRMLELQKYRFNISYKKLFREMKNRDDKDQNRLISPLYPSKNAIILDSTNVSFLEIINISMMHILKKIN